MDKTPKWTWHFPAPIWTVAEPCISITSLIAIPVTLFSNELQPVQKLILCWKQRCCATQIQYNLNVVNEKDTIFYIRIPLETTCAVEGREFSIRTET